MPDPARLTDQQIENVIARANIVPRIDGLTTWAEEAIAIAVGWRAERAEVERLEHELAAIKAVAERLHVKQRDAEATSEKLREALEKSRGYVQEPGHPGTVVETTEESAERSKVLLAEIDGLLDV